MAFEYLDETPQTGSFEYLDEPKTLAGLGQNAISDIGNIATGLGQTVKEGAYDMPKRALETGLGMAAGQPYSETPSGQRDVSLVQNAPEQLKEMAQPITHPIEYGYKNPISQTLNAAGLLSAAASPIDIIGQYAKQGAQNAGVRALGGARGQIGKLGAAGSRELAQSMIDKGVVSPFTGEIGMEAKIKDLTKKAGTDIGAARTAADIKGGAPQLPEILQRIKESLANKYASGVHKGETGGLNKAREELAKGGAGTFTGNAQKATDLNTFATKQKGLLRPATPSTDVADIITRMNEEAMQKTLSPAEYAKYKEALPAYGEGKHAQAFAERGSQKEITAPIGKGLSMNPLHYVPTHLMNRTAATVGSGLGDILRLAPQAAIPGAGQAAISAQVAEYLKKLYGQP